VDLCNPRILRRDDDAAQQTWMNSWMAPLLSLRRVSVLPPSSRLFLVASRLVSQEEAGAAACLRPRSSSGLGLGVDNLVTSRAASDYTRGHGRVEKSRLGSAARRSSRRCVARASSSGLVSRVLGQPSPSCHAGTRRVCAPLLMRAAFAPTPVLHSE